MTKTENPTQISNQYAMFYGLLLGLWTLITAIVGIRTIGEPMMSLVTNLMLFGCIGFAVFFTTKCRDAHLNASGVFSFGRAYIYCLLMCFYATVWAALGVYAYFAYIDGGAFAANLQQRLAQPEMQQMLHEMEAQGVFVGIYNSAGTTTIEEVIKVIASISPSAYAGMMVTWSLFLTPIASILIALVTMKRRKQL